MAFVARYAFDYSNLGGVNRSSSVSFERSAWSVQMDSAKAGVERRY